MFGVQAWSKCSTSELLFLGTQWPPTSVASFMASLTFSNSFRAMCVLRGSVKSNAWSVGNTISPTACSVSAGVKFCILYPGHKGHRATRCSDVQKHHQRCMWLLSILMLTSTISRPERNKINTITQAACRSITVDLRISAQKSMTILEYCTK